MKNSLKIILFTILMISVYGCNSKNAKKQVHAKKTVKEYKSDDYWVKNIGSRFNIIKDGNFSATVSLDSLLQNPNLFAIGPIEGLKGEITVNDGKVYVATMDNDNPKFSNTTMNTKAIFMVYGSCSEWIKIPTNGSDMEKPFPFKIEGKVNTLNYHIIYKKDKVPHNVEEHQKAKQKFEIANENIEVIGFWADAKGEGVYTHPGHRTHLHFTESNNNKSGHIDDIKLMQEAILYLPLVH